MQREYLARNMTSNTFVVMLIDSPALEALNLSKGRKPLAPKGQSLQLVPRVGSVTDVDGWKRRVM